jgi:hypothetical protein
VTSWGILRCLRRHHTLNRYAEDRRALRRAETGFLQRGGLWNNQAAFQAQIHLWLRQPDLARRNFLGFLNHAAPVYPWREEQALRGSTSALHSGDMPHISATSELIRYLRHMLALEVDTELRLLQGIGDPELSEREPFQMAASPTRFGRVSLALEPEAGARVWRLRFARAGGPAPTAVELPAALAGGFTWRRRRRPGRLAGEAEVTRRIRSAVRR